MEKIKIIVNKFLENGKQKTNDYNLNVINIDLLNEVISLLNNDIDIINENKLSICLLLDTIYQNDSYSKIFLNRLVKANNENNFNLINDLINNLNNLKINLINNQHILIREISLYNLYEKYCRIFLSSVNVNIPISFIVTDYIKKVLLWANNNFMITDKELTLLENEMNFYSQKIKSKDNERQANFINHKYEEIPNILRMGFQETDKIEINPNKKIILDNSIESLKSQIISIQPYEINDLLSNYENVYKDNNEFDYVLNKIMDDIINELLTYYEFLLDKDLNSTNLERKEIVDSYYKLLEKYLIIKSFYETREKKLYSFEEKDDENEKEDINNLNTKKIIYASSEVNPLNAKIISDLKNIPEEYYESILDLLINFKNNTLPKSKIKRLINNGKLSYLYEIKEFQTRIIFKRVQDDIICILGIFIKKDNNDIKEYKNIARRTIPQDIDKAIILSSSIENELFTLLNDKKRISKL
ncbi:MAG: hypothetical protein ACI4XR_05000 [Bacilli bacterium]